MAKKKNSKAESTRKLPKAYIEGAGVVVSETITETLEKNYMPYAMSEIISRALPEIDGFKPSHRKLLYTMYKMGLLGNTRTKSANVVGQTMRLNPHGDAAIYDTMVRLSRGNEALLHPYVDSKGNFGKAYSRNTGAAASRYTEVKLEPIAAELFRDIDHETVDFVPNYDNTMEEPLLLPASFPSVLVNANVGIAVSMASCVCPFNLEEICETTISLIQNPEHDILSTLKGPDFPTGAFLLYNEEDLRQIYSTGRGSVKLRAKYRYDAVSNCIEITEIPYGTTIEAITDKILDLIKIGKIKEISYIRDETDLDGLKIAIDLKRKVDPDALMQKLYRLTPLQDNYAANLNILIAGRPSVMGVKEILEEWIAFREQCVKRRVYFDLHKLMDKIHLLQGLQKILMDIDKAIRIIRETEEESEVVSNLMIGFGIDEIQAEYVAEIKLRHLNREYILKHTKQIEEMQNNIDELSAIHEDKKKIRKIIIKELKEVAKKYGQPRKTMFLYGVDEGVVEEKEEIPNYPVHLFISQSGYFKKITPNSLRMSGEQKLKEGDYLQARFDSQNDAELLFFTNSSQVYKACAADFDETKASLLGDYIPAKLGFDENELFSTLIVTKDYKGFLLFIFENGKIAKIPLNAYETKTKRKKLQNAYSDKSSLVAVLKCEDDCNVMLRSDNGRALIFNTVLLLSKTTKNSQGVQVMNLKKNAVVSSAVVVEDEQLTELKKYLVKSVPAAGGMAKEMQTEGQMELE